MTCRPYLRRTPVPIEPCERCPWCGSASFTLQNVFVCDDCGRGFCYPAMAKDVRRVEVKEDDD